MDTKLLEGMWTTRPIRPQTGRTISGVCVGIGNRVTAIDPTLVKVAFVDRCDVRWQQRPGVHRSVAGDAVQRRLSSSAAQAAVGQWYAAHSHQLRPVAPRPRAPGLPALDGLATGLRRPHVADRSWSCSRSSRSSSFGGFDVEFERSGRDRAARDRLVACIGARLFRQPAPVSTRIGKSWRRRLRRRVR